MYDTVFCGVAATGAVPGVEVRVVDVSDLASLDQDDPDLGASTAEYAVIVLAAAAFGGVMAVLTHVPRPIFRKLPF